MISYLSLPGPKMIFIPGGTYRMGDRGDVVTVGDFYMDETPVTVAQYHEAVNAGACTPPPYELKCNNWDNWDNCKELGRKDHPMNGVSWYQAEAYAEWAGKRLPSEEEWEWAARGGAEARYYPWGSEAPSDQLCWKGPGNDLGDGNRWSTSPVGSYPKGNSRHGIKDLAGNVWEWTSSTYSSTSEHKVVRGGRWCSSNPYSIRVATRYPNSPKNCDLDLGFRCVRDS